jgi:hypothetical protein
MEKTHNYMAESLLSISSTASILDASQLINDSEFHSLTVEVSGNILELLPITISVKSG